MTLPLGTGFPDFARQESEAQVLEINDINVTNGNGFGYPSRYVGNAKSLQLWANAVTNGLRVQFQFWGDNPNTVIMDSYVVQMRGNDVAKGPIPILGPWLTVIVQTETGGNQQYTLQLWRTPAPARFAGIQGEDPVFSENFTNIGATTTRTIDSQYVSEGPAVWLAQISGGNFAVELQAVDFQGVATDLDRINTDSPAMSPRTVYLPPHHIRVSATNFAAGAQHLYLFMTRRHNE